MMRAVRQVDLKREETYRARLAWDACTFGGNGSYVRTDFDLIAVNVATQQVVAYSASYQDNDEGFQFEVPEDGTYSIQVAWPVGSTACSGATEPVVLADVHGFYFNNPDR